MTGSVGWDGLPVVVRAAVERHTGPVTGWSPGGGGASTDVRLVLRTASGGVFVKGTGPDAGVFERERLALGAVLAPHVPGLSPPLLFRVEAGGWDITGWPALSGRPADLSPGSADIPVLAGLLADLGPVTAPDVPGLLTAGVDWGGADPQLAGGALVHTDPHGGNFVMGPGRAWLIDWGWAVRGAPWLTAARLVLFMMEAGWEPGDAEEALAGVPAWSAAPSAVVTAYAVASVRSWERAYARGRSSRVWLDIARAWAGHRAGLAGRVAPGLGA